MRVTLKKAHALALSLSQIDQPAKDSIFQGVTAGGRSNAMQVDPKPRARD